MASKNTFINSEINNPTFIEQARGPIEQFLNSPSEISENDFIGRQKELDDLLAEFFPHLEKNTLRAFFKKLFRAFRKKKAQVGMGKVHVLSGEGGIGKTTLAARYWSLHKKKYQHAAWVVCEPDFTTAMVETLHKELQLNGDDDLNKHYSELHTKLTNLPAPCLLVVDNVDRLEDVDAAYLKLSGLSNFHVLITSRITEFPGVEVSKIKGLQKGDALAFFKKHYAKLQPSDEKLLTMIRDAVGNNTLVLELMAKNLAAHNDDKSSYSLNDLLADLQERGLLQLSKSSGIRGLFYRGGRFCNTEPKDIIGAMYDLSSLSQEERSTLSFFAVLPVYESVPTDILLKLIEGFDEDGIHLRMLRQKGWLERMEAERAYQCVPVIREVVRNKDLDLRQNLQILVDTLYEKLNPDTIYDEDNYSQAAFLSRYAEQIRVFFTNTLDFDMALLCRRIGDYAKMTGDLDRALVHFSEGKSIAKQLAEQFPEDTDYKEEWATACQRLGVTWKEIGYLEEALAFFEEDWDLRKKLFEDAPNNSVFKGWLGISCQFLGSTHIVLGNLQQALNFFKEYNRLEIELHEAFPENVGFKTWLAGSYQFLGSTHIVLGNLQQALNFFEEYNCLEIELHETFPENVGFKNGLAISYERLGSTHTALGNLRQALNFFEEYNRFELKLHQISPQNVEFKNGLAISYERLGSTHTALGNLRQALNFFEEYNRFEIELHQISPQNVEFKNGLAISYERLSSTHTKFGNLHQAIAFSEESSRLVKELHEAFPENVDFKSGLAVSYENCGNSHAAVGNFQQALTFFEDFSRMAKELTEAFPQNVKYKKLLAVSYESLGNLYAVLGNFQQALTFFEDFSRMAKELTEAFPQNSDFKNGLAVSYWNLGWFYGEKMNNTATAVRYFQLCHDIWKEMTEDYLDNSEFRENYKRVKAALEQLSSQDDQISSTRIQPSFE